MVTQTTKCDYCKRKMTDEYSRFWMFGDRSGIAICSRSFLENMMDETNCDLQYIEKTDAEWRQAWNRYQDLVEML